jgi:MFS superfamily sulfate permease-like transporter
MTTEQRRGPSVDQGPFWAGVAATAVVAALAAGLGVVVLDVFDVKVLDPPIGAARGLEWAGAALVAAVLGGVLLLLLVMTTPRPRVFFGWIVGLVTATAAVLPFTKDTTTEAQVATCVLCLLIGLVVGTSLGAVAGRTVRRGG